MTAFINIVDHPLEATQREVFEVDPGASLLAWLEEAAGKDANYLYENQVMSVLLNGEQLAPADWDCVLEEGDSVVVVPRMGWDVVFYVVVAAVVGAAISQYLAPKLPGASNLLDTQSPSYSADAQGNRARLGSPIPVAYGEPRMWPDFAARPYRKYSNHDQYLYQVFSLGQTKALYSSERIGDTALSVYDAQVEYYAPGEKVTLFPTAVYESEEVRDIQLWGTFNDPEYADQPESPAYVACEPGDVVESIEVDIVFPQGLWHQDGEDVVPHHSEVEVLIRYIDDDGAPISGWQRGFFRRYSEKTMDVLRFTEKFDLHTPGRVEVKTRRTTGASGSPKRMHSSITHWAGLRGYLQDDHTYDHYTMALAIRVDDQLSHASERKVSVKLQAMLSVWDEVSGWSDPQVTRNPVWAMCDAIRARHGAAYSDNRLNLPALAAVADQMDADGITFDGVFDTPAALWSVLQQILMVGNAEPVLRQGVFSARRDVQEVAEYHYGMGEIVPGTFGLQWKTVDEYGKDSVEVEYTDPNTWKPVSVFCSVTGTTERPKKVTLKGCTSHDQAVAWGNTFAAQELYRNRTVKFQTELDGRLPNYGDTVRVSHELPNWCTSGVILEADGGDLLLSEPVDMSQGGYIQLKGPDGRIMGPYVATAGADDYRVSVTLGAGEVVRGSADPEGKFATSFFFATDSVSLGLPIKVRQVTSQTGSRLQVTGEYDAPEVYNPSAIPVAPPPPAAALVDLAVQGLRVESMGGLDDLQAQASWAPVQEALAYRVEYAIESGAFVFVSESPNPWARWSCVPGLISVRVAAKSAGGYGAWTTVSFGVGSDQLAPDAPANLQLVEAFAGREAAVSWDEEEGCTYQVTISDGASQVYRQVETADLGYRYTVEQAIEDGCGRSFRIEVRSLFKGLISVSPNYIDVSNPVPAAPTGVQALPGADALTVYVDAHPDEDLSGYVVNYQATDVDETIRFNGPATSFVIPIPRVDSNGEMVADDRVYSVRVSAFDAWGPEDLNFSAFVTDLVSGIEDSQLSQWLRDEIQKARQNTKTFRQPGIPSSALAKLNDLWFDTDDGHRLWVNIGTDTWEEVTDERVADALGLADEKARIFVVGARPDAAAEVGDIWIDSSNGNKTWVKTGHLAWTDLTDTRLEAALLDAQRQRVFVQGGQPLDSESKTGDLWIDSSYGHRHYTKQSNGLWQDVTDDRVQDALDLAGDKAQVFRETDAPLAGDSEPGDLWIDTDDGNKHYVYLDTGVWADVTDGRVQDALDKAERSSVFRQNTQPTDGESEDGDWWIDLDDQNRHYVRIAAGLWVDATDGRLDDAFVEIGERARVFYRVDMPSDLESSVGDLWIDIDDGNKELIRAGAGLWVDILDERVTAAQLDAVRKRIHRQNSQPLDADTEDGDLWIDLDGDFRYYIRTAPGVWVESTDSRVQDALEKAERQRTFYQTDAPLDSVSEVGDIWVDTDDDNRHFVKTAVNTWTDMTDGRITEALAEAQRVRFFRQNTAPGAESKPTDIWIDTDRKSTRLNSSH